MYGGNLHHACVNNVEENEVKLARLQELKKWLSMATQGKNDKVYSKVFDILCSFDGLNKFSRLHTSTIKLEEDTRPPINQDGFSNANDMHKARSYLQINK